MFLVIPVPSPAMPRFCVRVAMHSTGSSRSASSAGRPMSSWPRASVVDRRVIGPDEIKPVGRCVEPQRGPIACFERGAHIIRRPFALADQRQTTDHRTYLMMQERSRRGEYADPVATLHHIEPVERAQRAVG